jgi:amino acid adenylation domain-containing protein
MQREMTTTTNPALFSSAFINDALATEREYWAGKLSGELPRSGVPTDFIRPEYFREERHSSGFLLDGETAAKLVQVCQSNRSLAFTVFVAALDICLFKYSRNEDVVVGATIHDRHRELAVLNKVLVLRDKVCGARKVRQLLGDVKRTISEAYANQKYPFDRLLDLVGLDYPINQAPLFNVAILMDGINDRENLRHLKTDLTLALSMAEKRVSGEIEYNPALFKRETVEAFSEFYCHAVWAVLNNPDLEIEELDLTPPGHKQKLLFDFNLTERPYDLDKPLHRLFEQQAEKTPNDIALLFGDTEVTYRQLDRKANQLAHYLIEKGVGPETLVGVCLERGIEMIVALMGILKAGGAYLPLDPAYPKERIAFMIEDSRMKALVTEESCLSALPDHKASVVSLDREGELIARSGDQNPVSGVQPENLAYVIYTSGSTGKPKGALITHANVARLFAATHDQFRFDEKDVWTGFHSYAFDFSVWEIFGALSYGGSLVVVPYWVSRNPEAFEDLLVKESVTVLNQTPSAFRQLINEDLNRGDEPLNLRVVVFGGEALDLKTLKPWVNKHGDERPQLVNMYGITETTVHVTYRRITEADTSRGQGSVIGMPIGDLQVYLLDAQMQLVPAGVPGELFVAGAGLARGYLNRSDLTADRFVPDPFGGPGDRLYRTGDVGRRLTDGSLEFVGRNDHQVKIRGHRIELGEIEAVAASHSAVRDCIVIARSDDKGEKRLVCYVVPARGGVKTEELREHFKSRLPDHMVPSAIVTLEQMPLTVNGKLDLSRLPEPAQSRRGLDSELVAPRTEVEEILAAVWSQVLGVEEIGINDNFFALGGDSIHTVSVVALAKERGIDCSIQQVFLRQTISELAREIEAHAGRDLGAARTEPFSLVPRRDLDTLPPGIEDAYPLTMLQLAMIYHMELKPDSRDYHNVCSFRLGGRFDPDVFQEAMRRIVERHAILRTSFDLVNYSEPLQLVHKQVEFPLAFHDIRHLSHDEQEELLDDFVLAEKWNRFTLSQPPLLRFIVHLRGDNSFQFTVTEHHSILDGWSLTSIIHEVFDYHYGRLNTGAFPDDPPLAITYRDYVKLERDALESEQCRAFWAEKLQDCAAMPLPRWPSFVREDGGPRVRRIEAPFSNELSSAVARFARSALVPIKSVCLAAHVKVLSLISGQGDILTGLPTHGRPEDVDGERVRGLFLNTLPFRFQLDESSWQEFVQSIFEAERQILPYRHYPLGAIHKNWLVQPLFETTFGFVHFHHLKEMFKQGGDLQIQSGAKRIDSANFVLHSAFNMFPPNFELRLNLQYDATQLCEEQVRSYAECYARVLTSMTAGPARPHSEFDVPELLTEIDSTIFNLSTAVEELDGSFAFSI